MSDWNHMIFGELSGLAAAYTPIFKPSAKVIPFLGCVRSRDAQFSHSSPKRALTRFLRVFLFIPAAIFELLFLRSGTWMCLPIFGRVGSGFLRMVVPPLLYRLLVSLSYFFQIVEAMLSYRFAPRLRILSRVTFTVLGHLLWVLGRPLPATFALPFPELFWSKFRHSALPFNDAPWMEMGKQRKGSAVFGAVHEAVPIPRIRLPFELSLALH